MNWNREKAVRATSPLSPQSNGVFCLFVQLSETEGVKFYKSANLRDRAAAHQTEAYAAGLAPRVGASCEMPCLASWKRPDSWREEVIETVYGYVTEVATDVGRLKDNELRFLLFAMQEHNFRTDDMHCLNAGKVNGWPVCIDFDPAFFGGDDELKKEWLDGLLASPPTDDARTPSTSSFSW